MTRKTRRVSRLVSAGSLAAVLSAVVFVAPASAAAGPWESLLGGHLGGQRQAQRLAVEAGAKGFTTHIQEINPHDWEAEIFNGGTKIQAEAVCAKAHAAGFPHCSVERGDTGPG